MGCSHWYLLSVWTRYPCDIYLSFFSVTSQHKQDKMKSLFIIAMLVGVASCLDTCCRYQNVRCFQGNSVQAQHCDVPSHDELAQCPEECPLKGCDPFTLLKCGAILLKCAAVCVPAPIAPPCVLCMGDSSSSALGALCPDRNALVA